MRAFCCCFFFLSSSFLLSALAVSSFAVKTAAAEAAEATAAVAATAAAAVRMEVESAGVVLNRAQQQVTRLTEPLTPPRPSGKAPPTLPRPAPQYGAPRTPLYSLSMQQYLQAQAQAQDQAQTHVQMPNQAHVKTQTHVQMQAQAYVKPHEVNMKAQALVQKQPLASPWTPSKTGASSGSTAASRFSAPASTNDKPASANKGFGSPGRFHTPTPKSEYCCVTPN